MSSATELKAEQPAVNGKTLEKQDTMFITINTILGVALIFLAGDPRANIIGFIFFWAGLFMWTGFNIFI